MPKLKSSGTDDTNWRGWITLSEERTADYACNNCKDIILPNDLCVTMHIYKAKKEEETDTVYSHTVRYCMVCTFVLQNAPKAIDLSPYLSAHEIASIQAKADVKLIT